MTRYLIIALTVSTLATNVAAESISGNVTLTTDYIYRGVSQTLEEPAIQGGIDFNSASGFYLGVWGSNVDFGSDAQVEFDGYLGFTREQSNGFSWDVGLIHYNYPGEDTLNFEELYAGIGFKDLTFKISVSDDFAGTGGEGQYLEAGYERELGRGFSLGLHIGQSLFDESVGILDYLDYKVAVARAFKKVQLELAFVDTDENQFADLDGERVVFSISVTP